MCFVGFTSWWHWRSSMFMADKMCVCVCDSQLYESSAYFLYCFSTWKDRTLLFQFCCWNNREWVTFSMHRYSFVDKIASKQSIGFHKSVNCTVNRAQNTHTERLWVWTFWSPGKVSFWDKMLLFFVAYEEVLIFLQVNPWPIKCRLVIQSCINS